MEFNNFLILGLTTQAEVSVETGLMSQMLTLIIFVSSFLLILIAILFTYIKDYFTKKKNNPKDERVEKT